MRFLTSTIANNGAIFFSLKKSEIIILRWHKFSKSGSQLNLKYHTNTIFLKHIGYMQLVRKYKLEISPCIAAHAEKLDMHSKHARNILDVFTI